MLKLLGICLVMAGCTGSGWYLSGRKLHRIHVIDEWDKSLQLLYGEVEYAGREVPELIENMERHSHYTRNFWHRLGESLCCEYPERLQKLWQRELSHPEWHILGQEERSLLEELGGTLGQTDRQSQMRALQLYRERLEMIRKQARESYQGQSKVYHVAGITVGCFLVILLL